MPLARLYHRLRQRRVPLEFRIPEPSGGGLPDGLEETVRELLAELRRPEPTAADSPGTHGNDAAQGPIRTSLAISLCDDYWRARQNADLLATRGESSKEVRMILRHLQDLEDVLRENGVRCVDLAGQEFDPGRTDFEPLGEATPVEGILKPRILRCERPAIWLDRKLVRPARGLVERPA